MEHHAGVSFKMWVNTSSLTEGEYVTSRGERTRVHYHTATPLDNRLNAHTFNCVPGVPGAIWITMETARNTGDIQYELQRESILKAIPGWYDYACQQSQEYRRPMMEKDPSGLHYFPVRRNVPPPESETPARVPPTKAAPGKPRSAPPQCRSKQSNLCVDSESRSTTGEPPWPPYSQVEGHEEGRDGNGQRAWHAGRTEL